mmetsp:Transcript_120769/g.225761  ORF Transcript_120769/g.225761 Transcript_120769/m.225761 type:complete len:453 (+) Transcript_120769:139-1497(+)
MGEDHEPSHVLLRPYSAECEGLAGWQNWQEGLTPPGIRSTPGEASSASASSSRAPAGRPRAFKPKPPSERRHVERASLSSTSVGASPEAMLQEAWRTQQLSAEDPGRASRFRGKEERFTGMSLSKFGVTSFGTASLNARDSETSSGVPRKLKERREGKSLELMDLAFSGEKKLVNGEIVTNYAPISLPFFDVREEEEEDLQNDATARKKKSRPAMMHVDEMNANAAKALFLNADGDLQEDQIILMQLPAVLPELLDPTEEVQREQEDASSVGQGATITRLPDGLLGKLRIHKSGKVKMQIGELEFCVDQGCDTFFQQDLACVCPSEKEMFALGQIHKRMVLTPDIDKLTADLSEAALRSTNTSEEASATNTSAGTAAGSVFGAATVDTSARSRESSREVPTAAGPAVSFAPGAGASLRAQQRRPGSAGPARRGEPGRPTAPASSGARARGRS